MDKDLYGIKYLLAFFLKKKTVQENWKIRKTLLQISLQPILGEVSDEKMLWQKVTPCRTSHWIDSRCFKVLQISNWKRPCLRGSKGLLKLFPLTNPVMNSMSSPVVVPPEKYPNLIWNPTRIPNPVVKWSGPAFSGSVFMLSVATGHKNANISPICVPALSKFSAAWIPHVPQRNPCWRAHWRPNLQPHTSGWSQYESPRVYTWNHGIAWPLGCYLEVANG